MQATRQPLDDAPALAAQAGEAAAPLVTGDAFYLWIGAGAVLFVAVLLFVILGRWRAGRRARNASRDTEFFQPAGEGAEITFDESPFDQGKSVVNDGFSALDYAPDHPPQAKKQSPFAGLFAKRGQAHEPEFGVNAEALEVVEDDPSFASVRIERQGAAGVADDRTEYSNDRGEAPSPAADWAAIERDAERRAEEERQREAGRRANEEAEWEARRRAEQEAERDRERRAEAERRREAERRAQEEAEWEARRRAAQEAERDAERRAAEAAEREAMRRAQAAEADERLRAIEESRQRRIDGEDRARLDFESARGATAGSSRFAEPSPATHEEIVRTLSEVEEALHAQREAIQAETRSLLDGFARRFGERLDALASAMERRSQQRPAEAPADRARDGALVDAIARRLDDHRKEVAGVLSALAHKMEATAAVTEDASALREELALFREALNGAVTQNAPAVQLSDIVRNVLTPGAYEFNAVLPNNRRADCLVKLARPPGPIAIDARFPVEAFHALRQTPGAPAENEFRRAALRHIVDIAERLIAPGFTADSAMMFVPSESMAAELHARFPDIIQDGYRARVWVVSPTSLTATLHAMSALLRDAPPRDYSSGAAESAARRALAEVERLSERIAALEVGSARERRPIQPANDPRMWERDPADSEPERALRRLLQTPVNDGDEDRAGDLYADEHIPDGSGDAPHRPAATRPPFPLR